MAKVTRSTSSSDAESSSAIKKKTGTDREQGDSARRVYESVIDESPVQAATGIWRDIHNRWGAGTSVAESASPQQGEGVMRFIVALLALLVSDAAMAEPQRQTFKDANGRTLGRSVTDTRGQHHVLRLDGSQHRTVGHRQPWQHHVLRLDGSQHRTVNHQRQHDHRLRQLRSSHRQHPREQVTCMTRRHIIRSPRPASISIRARLLIQGARSTRQGPAPSAPLHRAGAPSAMAAALATAASFERGTQRTAPAAAHRCRGRILVSSSPPPSGNSIMMRLPGLILLPTMFSDVARVT